MKPSDDIFEAPTQRSLKAQLTSATAVLPTELYTCDQVRELDRISIEEYHIPGIILMKRAGKAAFEVLQCIWPSTERVIVFCGGGNNGGDGFVVAALAAQACLSVEVVVLGDLAGMSRDAKAAHDYAVQEGVPIVHWDKTVSTINLETENTVVVDALLGAGLSGSIRPQYQVVIDYINKHASDVLSLDIPSGLSGDTGAELGRAVKANVTTTFIGCKRGLLTGKGPARTGELFFADLGVPGAVYDQLHGQAKTSVVQRIAGDSFNDNELASDFFAPREADAHKGQFGHCLIVGGDSGYGGAALMAAEAALHCGSGLVSVASQPAHVSAALVRRPEVMAVGVVSGQELEPHLDKPSVLVVGPGLGQTPWSEQMFLAAFKSQKTMVLDADGLNLLAARFKHRAPYSQWILTPHPGEAARLLDCDIADVQADRFEAVKRLQAQYGGVVVLKGAGTLICDGQNTWLAYVGNPGMASGGMGDVLSGVIGALLAQGLPQSTAACLGVWFHGTAGDMAAEQYGQRGLLATELLPYLRELMNS